METALFAQGEAAEQTELIEAKQDDHNPADTGKPCPIIVEKFAYCRESKSKQEKSKADAKDEKQGVSHNPSSFIGDIPFFIHCLCTSGQITDVQRYQREYARGKEADKPLKKNGDSRDTCFKCQIHKNLHASFACKTTACKQR